MAIPGQRFIHLHPLFNGFPLKEKTDARRIHFDGCDITSDRRIDFSGIRRKAGAGGQQEILTEQLVPLSTDDSLDSA